MPNAMNQAVIKGLLDDGSVPMGRLGVATRDAIRPLVATGILRQERSGGGECLVVVRLEAFLDFVKRECPGVLRSEIDTASPRAQGIHHHGRSKSLGGTLGEPVVLRGGPGATLNSQGRSWSIFEAEALGGMSFVLRTGGEWSLGGPAKGVALVENVDVFLSLDVARLQETLSVDAAIFLRGKMSNRFLTWLASPSMTGVRYLHLGDYDPVGIAEYLRLLGAVSAQRAAFYLPPDLPGFFERWKDSHLLGKKGNRIQLDILRRQAHLLPADGLAVLDQIRKWNRCVEHEALVLEPWPTVVPDPFLR